MKKYLPYILTVLFFGIMLFLSIILNSCNYSAKKHICVIDSFNKRNPISVNEIQTTYVYHTSCNTNLYAYDNNKYHINDTIKY